MRIGRVLVLLLAVALAGLLSGGAASPAPVAAAGLDAAGALLGVYSGAAAPAAPAPEAPAPPAAPTRRTVPLLVHDDLPAPAPRPVAGTPCRSDVDACVDLAANLAWLIDDGVVSYGPVPITHGRRGHRTPPGTFDVDFRNRDHVSSIYGAPMPYSVFFNRGIAFHQGSLRELSHGCIHLSRDAAREFFDSLRRLDLVQVV